MLAETADNKVRDRKDISLGTLSGKLHGMGKIL